MKKPLNDRPMEYKLVWDRDEYYNLKYRVKDATLWEKLTKWWAGWTTLMKYYEPSDYNFDWIGFTWLSYDFQIKDNKAGVELIRGLYDKCPTFGKFYKAYRKPQHEKEEKYKQRKKEYFDRINRVKSEFK